LFAGATRGVRIASRQEATGPDIKRERERERERGKEMKVDKKYFFSVITFSNTLLLPLFLLFLTFIDQLIFTLILELSPIRFQGLCI
jgi:hypothetical protein